MPQAATSLSYNPTEHVKLQSGGAVNVFRMLLLRLVLGTWLLPLLLLLCCPGTWSSGLPSNTGSPDVLCQNCPAGQTSDTGATSPDDCCECSNSRYLQACSHHLH